MSKKNGVAPLREGTATAVREAARSGVPESPTTPARPKRRTFAAEYKLRIVREADAALASGAEGAIGELLRREGLYSSHLTVWRRERDAGELAGLTPKKRGRKSSKNELADENVRLLRQVESSDTSCTRPTRSSTSKKSRELAGGDAAGTDGGRVRARSGDLGPEAPVIQGLVSLIAIVGIIAACLALGVNRASYYRAQKPKPPPQPRPRPARALGDDERAHLDSDPFMDKAPAQVYAKLLEDGEYLCSTRTMYRVLDDASQVRARRHPEYVKPQLVATAPNQVWTWATTKLPGSVKGTYYTLYVIARQCRRRCHDARARGNDQQGRRRAHEERAGRGGARAFRLDGNGGRAR